MALPGSEARDGHRELTRRTRRIGAIAWASFLAACAGTMFFFAFVAPDSLLGDYPESDRIDRIGVYTLGFFGLWCLGALASALALYLHAPSQDGAGDKRNAGDGT
jgi:hypothetical protein